MMNLQAIINECVKPVNENGKYRLLRIEYFNDEQEENEVNNSFMQVISSYSGGYNSLEDDRIKQYAYKDIDGRRYYIKICNDAMILFTKVPDEDEHIEIDLDKLAKNLNFVTYALDFDKLATRCRSSNEFKNILEAAGASYYNIVLEPRSGSLNNSKQLVYDKKTDKVYDVDNGIIGMTMKQLRDVLGSDYRILSDYT